MTNTTLTLNAFGKTYNLELVKSTYANNGRPYFGLENLDPEHPGHFCDISENHPEFTNEQLSEYLPGHQVVIIDNDFFACFPSIREAKIWIIENIPECVITGDFEGRPVFYIKDDRQHD